MSRSSNHLDVSQLYPPFANMGEEMKEAFLKEFDRLYDEAYAAMKEPGAPPVSHAATWFPQDLVDMIQTFAFENAHPSRASGSSSVSSPQAQYKPLRSSFSSNLGSPRSSTPASQAKSPGASPKVPSKNPYLPLTRITPAAILAGQVEHAWPAGYYPPPYEYVQPGAMMGPGLDADGQPLPSSYDAFFASMQSRRSA